MTDKEVKQLTRPQLIDIIYQLQTREEELAGENSRLTEALQCRRIRMEQAGDIARAALELNDVFQSAQNAARQYLDEIQALRQQAELEKEQMIRQAEETARQLICQAEEQAQQMIRQAEEQIARRVEDAKAILAAYDDRGYSYLDLDALLEGFENTAAEEAAEE